MTQSKGRSGQPTKARKKPQPPDKGSKSILALRISDDLLAEIDAEVERLKEENPGANLARSDVVRIALIKHLRAQKTGKSSKGA